MKIVPIRICVGQRPLHSEKLLVRIAIRRSRALTLSSTGSRASSKNITVWSWRIRPE